jgi:hypothetical protein
MSQGPRRVDLPSGEPRIAKLREALADRPAGRRIRGPAPRDGLPGSEAARRFWSARAWSEFAAVPAMAQTTLAIVREGGSLDALDALARINSDEVRHTELSRDLAEAFGGYVCEVPEDLPYRPHGMAEALATDLAFWLAGNGCVNETISLELMKLRLPYRVKSILQAIAKDEAMHCRVSWILAEDVFPRLDATLKYEVAEYALDNLDMLPQAFSTSGLPPGRRRSERKIRREVSDAGLGAAPPDEEDQKLFATRDELILPRLRKLGLPV